MTEEKRGPGRPAKVRDDETAAKPTLAPVKLFYDYWLDEDTRLATGSVVSLPVAEAKALIAAGKAERADPMPGEG